MFHQPELLILAYLSIVIGMACSSVLAKALGDRLIDIMPGRPLKQLLSRKLNMAFTGDAFLNSLFEARLLRDTRSRLFLLNLLPWLNRFRGNNKPSCVHVDHVSERERLFPGQYWSGYPPQRQLAPHASRSPIFLPEIGKIVSA